MHILGIFHVQIAQKWPKSHNLFPWQPGLKVTSLIPVFDSSMTRLFNYRCCMKTNHSITLKLPDWIRFK